MVEVSTVYYKSRCDWCGLEKEGSLSANDFTILSIIDPDYRKQRSSSRFKGLEERHLLFLTEGKDTHLCPSCYEPVRVFLNQMFEDRRKMATDMRSNKQNV